MRSEIQIKEKNLIFVNVSGKGKVKDRNKTFFILSSSGA